MLVNCLDKNHSLLELVEHALLELNQVSNRPSKEGVANATEEESTIVAVYVFDTTPHSLHF